MGIAKLNAGQSRSWGMGYHRPVVAPSTRYRHLAEMALDFLSAEGAPRPAADLARRLFAPPGSAMQGGAPQSGAAGPRPP